MLPNHHMAKPVMIGEVQADGQFSIVYQSKALPPKPWSPYVEANKDKVSNWSWPWVCGGCRRHFLEKIRTSNGHCR
jgi:urea transport system substrate-binding protein